MRIKPSTRIHAMLRIHPQLEEVLEDHDLDVDAINSTRCVGQLRLAKRIEKQCSSELKRWSTCYSGFSFRHGTR